MPIPFPRMHIAQSVLNRIMNTLDEIEPPAIAAVQPEPPIVEEPLDEGLTLDASLEQPLPGTTANQQQQEGLLAESVVGGSPMQGALAATGSF